MEIDDDLEARAAVHAALADPIRLGIVDELAWSDRMPSELQIRFGITSNLLAHHLQVLEDAGLVSRSVSHGDRRRRYVHLDVAALREMAPSWRFSVPGVVFVCTHNSARSQLAAALWRTVSDVPATSGGTEPAERVHPGAIREAARRGIELAAARPVSLDRLDLADRLVVTVCDVAHETLDDLSRSTSLPVLHWSVADPAADETDVAFTRAATDLHHRVTALAAVTDAA